MSEPEQSPRGSGRFTGRCRWIVIGLAASLAVNGVLLGYLGARVFGEHDRQRGSATAFFSDGRRFIRSLPHERRDELREIARTHRDEFRTLRQDVRQAKLKLADALEVEPYNAAAVEKALVQLQRTLVAIGDAGRAVTLEIIPELTLDERRALANDLRQPRRRR